MNTLKAISLLALATVMVACGGGDKSPADQKAAAVELKTVVNLPTMKCNTCARHITHTVQGVEGVKAVDVSVDNKTATVVYMSDKADVAKIELAIAKSGYNANSTPRDSAAYEKLDECCK